MEVPKSPGKVQGMINQLKKNDAFEPAQDGRQE